MLSGWPDLSFPAFFFRLGVGSCAFMNSINVLLFFIILCRLSFQRWEVKNICLLDAFPTQGMAISILAKRLSTTVQYNH